MRLEFGRRREERLVGGNDRQFELVGEIDEPVFMAAIILAVPLQFDIEAITKNCRKRLQTGFRQRMVTGLQGHIDRTAQGAGQSDQALRSAFLQPGQGDANRLVSFAAEIGPADDIDETDIAGIRRGNQNDGRQLRQMLGVPAFLALAFVLHVDRQLAADPTAAGHRPCISAKIRVRQTGCWYLAMPIAGCPSATALPMIFLIGSAPSSNEKAE